jgi:hypothetical protein
MSGFGICATAKVERSVEADVFLGLLLQEKNKNLLFLKKKKQKDFCSWRCGAMRV